ncbi:MAG: AraC family transcriptional regulator [Oscillospiraceae bacterium]|nr:AraC family transcriptional regulator [Oscillospiraceae bacterium]
MKEQQSYKHSMKLERRTASLYVQNTGCQQCPPCYGWGPGVRNHFLLHHVLSGKGVYLCRDERYELNAGDTFLVYPNTTIHYCADSQEPWEYIWVGFSGMDAAACVARTDFSPDAPVLRGRDSGEIRKLLEDIFQSFGTTAWENLEMTARLYSFLSFLTRTAQRAQEDREGVPDCAQMAAEYIINHYEEPITVEGLAAYTAVSHSSLYRRFVRRFQVSPKRFLLEYRIERACTLLSTTNCSIQEVATSVGFEDPFYFSRAFKDVKGLSPRQYAYQVRAGREPPAVTKNQQNMD